MQRAASSAKRIRPKGCVLPEEVALAMCMGQSHLGEKSAIRALDLELCRQIAEMYEEGFWRRPWESKETSEAEDRFSSGMSVRDLSEQLGRREGDVRQRLGIHDGGAHLDEDKIREMEHRIRKGGMICDVENWGTSVLISACAIMPSHFGLAGAQEVCHFHELPTRLKAIMIGHRCVHDPENMLGWGNVVFNPRTM